MKAYKVFCGSCQALVLNGVPCHEIGCPDAKRTWHLDEETLTVSPRQTPFEFDQDETFETDES